MTHAACKTSCKAPAPSPPSPAPAPPAPSPPVARYGCNPGIEPGLCYEAAGGEFETKETCDANCHFIPHLYKCVAGTGCVQDAAGTFKSEAECLVSCGNPPPPPPPEEKYKCENDKCTALYYPHRRSVRSRGHAGGAATPHCSSHTGRFALPPSVLPLSKVGYKVACFLIYADICAVAIPI